MIDREVVSEIDLSEFVEHPRACTSQGIIVKQPLGQSRSFGEFGRVEDYIFD